MKTTKLIAIMAIVILAVSCKKDNTTAGGVTGQEILTMKVNGVDWIGDDNLSGYKLNTNNKANIGGRKISSDETLVITGVEVTTTGTFVLNPALSHTCSFLIDGASPKIYSISASNPKARLTMVVSKINTGSFLDDLEGTFSGVLYRNATDSVVITNGVFKFN